MPIAEFAKDGYSTRDFVLITDEATQNECKPQGRAGWSGSPTSPSRAHPTIVSNFMVPEASGDFCSRGGRFGAHSTNESMDPVFYKKLAFITFFNAGVRVVDVRDPYAPKEVGYFIPAITEVTGQAPRPGREGQQKCKVAIQTNNAETDDCGYCSYRGSRQYRHARCSFFTGEPRAIAGPGAAIALGPEKDGHA